MRKSPPRLRRPGMLLPAELTWMAPPYRSAEGTLVYATEKLYVACELDTREHAGSRAALQGDLCKTLRFNEALCMPNRGH